MLPWADILAQLPAPCPYIRDEIPHVEPTAVLGLAMLATDAQRFQNKIRACHAWLAERQLPDGSLPPNAQLELPGWGTSWALLFEAATRAAGIHDAKTLDVHRGLDWLLATRGMRGETGTIAEHAVELVGWPWVTGTHTWLEPTCLAVMALKRQGLSEHPRCREGVQVLRDRLLPSGGANYGNTIVLGQELLPHIQATGFVLLALAGEADTQGLIAKSQRYVSQAIGMHTGATSLAYALLGLHESNPPTNALDLIESAGARVLRRDGSPYRLATLAWAAVRYQKKGIDLAGSPLDIETQASLLQETGR